MLPTFIIIGAAKAGTTTMFDLLGEHPDVFVPHTKEPSYFSRLATFSTSQSWYESLFAEAGAVIARGEASVSYTHPERIEFVAPRLAEHVPHCRLIYMVRHPVRRLESDWKMRVLEGRVPPAIGQAVDKKASLITFGMYWKHLNFYREYFPDGQILVVFLEDLARDPISELRRAYRHIGVDPTFVPASVGQPRNTAQERALSITVAKIRRWFPVAGRVASWLPNDVLQLTKKVLVRAQRHEVEPEWSPEELKAVLGYFREDSRRLLKFCGKPADYWDLGYQG